jgi:hypothetical protein
MRSVRNEDARAAVVHEGRSGQVAERECNLAVVINVFAGVPAPDYPAAAGWYVCAADAALVLWPRQ